MRPFGGPIRQIGLVVDDIDEAISSWSASFDVGPFFKVEDQPLVDSVFRGVASAARISVAVAQAGSLQVEFVKPLDAEPSSFREFQLAHGSGLQHIAYWTDDFDRVMVDARARGFSVVQSGRSGSGGPNERFAFLEHSSGAVPVVEVSEVLGAKARLYSMVEQAAQNWDGTDPVRDIRKLLR